MDSSSAFSIRTFVPADYDQVCNLCADGMNYYSQVNGYDGIRGVVSASIAIMSTAQSRCSAAPLCAQAQHLLVVAVSLIVSCCRTVPALAGGIYLKRHRGRPLGRERPRKGNARCVPHGTREFLVCDR